MAKTKTKTIKAFRGRRRRSYNRSENKEVVERKQELGPDPGRSKMDNAEVSASFKKMQLHGFDLELCESETNPRLLEDASQDNFFLIIQKQSLLNLLKSMYGLFWLSWVWVLDTVP